MTPHALLDATGWFGKLPGAGDFAQRRLPPAVVERWDTWLQRGMAQLRHRDPDWLQHYLQAPVLHGNVGAGLIDGQAWRVVIMPSVDAVGRYFPLTVMAPEVAAGAGAAPQAFAPWRACVTDAMLQALAEDDDATRFDRRLQAALMTPRVVPPGAGADPLAVAPGFSRWWPDGTPVAHANVTAMPELPTADRFAAYYLSPASPDDPA